MIEPRLVLFPTPPDVTVLPPHMLPAERLEQEGWMIDRKVWPWLAYKGPRFAPFQRFHCRTPEWVPVRGPEKDDE